MTPVVSQEIGNWIGGTERPAAAGGWFEKLSPHDGRALWRAARSDVADVAGAVDAARAAQPGWAAVPPVQRGHALHQLCNALETQQAYIASVVAQETGKSHKEALGETGGAVALGRFYAGEGQRLYGRTNTSGTVNKYAMTVRQPCGVAGLIIAANTPIANVAWKVFPALICGNGVVLKAAEDTPATAWLFAAIAAAGNHLPPGVLNVVQGIGNEAGRALVEHPGVDVLSFTGSTAVGAWIGEVAGRTLKKVSLELGGKNPFVVCDDADLDQAVKWACLSAFSNAGQRCASGSRIIVFDAIADAFIGRMVSAAEALKLGPDDDDDLGSVINERQLDNMLASVERARAAGARLLAGGHRMTGPEHVAGCYLKPTLLDNVDPDAEISTCELFGPVATIYRVGDYAEALALANRSPYGLTACIHSRNFDRAMHFVHHVHAGVAVVNAGTYGSEPHMPFGGVKRSGNGSREPGVEALDIYSDLKDIYINVEPNRL